ncbi:MAG: hypothetical protein CVU39_22750 [Chloroflexi bacterium HGW-Chloroflexi-10]|nr:MAG: hypothetical protein CVU39_22750 [Chloroflexi bacterium HGW-Chloroflexi-10]
MKKAPVRPIFFGITLCILLIAGILFRNVLFTFVIEPIGIFFWAIYRVLLSVDQKIFWFVLMVFAGYIVLRNMPASVDEYKKYTDAPSPKSIKGVQYWHQVFTGTAAHGKSQKTVSLEMKDLLISVIASQERLPKTKVIAALDNQQYPLPATTYAFLYPKKETMKTGLFKLNGLLPLRLKNGRLHENREQNEIVEELLQWIETYMEIHNDA